MNKICIKTFGCSANIAETEIMAGILKQAGFLISSEKDAELIILNICTVKGDAVALKRIRDTRQNNPYKKIIVAGCVTKEIIPEIRAIAPDASIISTHNIDDIVSVAEETLNNNPVAVISSKKIQKLGLPRKRKNSAVGIVQICNGCDSACAYCSVRLIKGKLVSYPIQLIVEEVKRAVADGCKEIWLTGQDTGCYGADIGTNLPALLKEVLAVEGDFFVRLGMANPGYVLKYADELITLFKHPKMFKFLHAPVQSGSEEVVKAMKRRHTVEDYRQIVKKFRQAMPELTMATDIICGFPGETKEQFQETLDLIKETKTDVVNISRFAARPNTLAAKMTGQVPGGEIKERSKKLSEVFAWTSFEQNQKWKNWRGEILIDCHCKNNTSIGRNYAYKPVVVEGDLAFGQKVKVKITGITKYNLRAEIQ